MTVTQQPAEGGAWLVSVDGRLAQELSQELERALLDLLQDNHQRLIVDLSGASYVNSGGLRTLVSAWRQARQQGGDLVLVGLSRQVRDVFDIVGFQKVFQIFPTLEEATQALASDS